MASKPKILVCGDVEGKFKTVFTRVHSINEKNGPFDFLICVGNFFGPSRATWEPYQNGTLTVPIPTYILGPNTSEHTALYSDINGCEMCPNISYLGKRGQFSASSGLKIAYVCGIEGESNTQDHNFTTTDVTAVRDICLRGQPSFRGVDVLLTSSWPKGITNFDEKAALNQSSSSGSHLLSWLAAQIKPRYHFSGLEGLFYERPPYKNHNAKGDLSDHATRFIGLAKVGNPSKQKWIYALTIEPIDKMKASELYQHTTDMTNCPYQGAALNHALSNIREEKSAQFFYDMNAGDGGPGHRKRFKKDEGQEKKTRPVFDQGTCWFCLASPEVEKHLVISIGTEVYLALAKGGLVPEHLLILPVGHHQALSDIPDSVRAEIKQFKSSLKKYFRSINQVPVYFERNYKTSHLQIQVVPIGSGLAVGLKDIFQEQAVSQGVQLDELPVHAKLEQIAPPGTPYFYAELPTGEKMFARAKKNFPLQLGRDILASSQVLDMEDRADWRDCKLEKEDETNLAKQFRAAYQPFDFTLT